MAEDLLRAAWAVQKPRVRGSSAADGLARAYESPKRDAPISEYRRTKPQHQRNLLALLTTCAGQSPPVEAFGALVAGYARMRQVEAAVDAVRRYHAAGGAPDVHMLRSLADVCVRMGEYKVAMQVGRISVLGC